VIKASKEMAKYILPELLKKIPRWSSHNQTLEPGKKYTQRPCWFHDNTLTLCCLALFDSRWPCTQTHSPSTWNTYCLTRTLTNK